MNQMNHARRFTIWWLVASIVLTALVVFVLAPGLPPGNNTVQAHGQVVDNIVLLGLSAPVACGVVLYLVYAIMHFRDRSPAGSPIVDGPPITGNSSLQMWWLISTTALVLFLAGFGSVRLLEDGAGSGQGPTPLSKPAGYKHALQVQVIAQQWQFTYRYPQYGGVEVSHLELPANTLVEFHVTSLDVIHSFWAYQLGVKADANPGTDNVAFVTTENPFTFQIHCVELCGVWHGYMFDSGQVVSKPQFASWIQGAQKQYAPVTKTLPPYSTTYLPDPQRRGG